MPQVKRAPSQRIGRTPLQRLWISELLLLVYVLLVHGLPALHLGWHGNDHVHEHGALRWLAPRPEAHLHTRAGRHLETAPRRAPALSAPRAQLQEPQGASLEAVPHLAQGPLHGQLSLLIPTVLASVAGTPAQRLPGAALLSPSLRTVTTRRRARAPPARS